MTDIIDIGTGDKFDPKEGEVYEIDNGLIEYLERLHKLAKRGKIKSICIAGVYNNDDDFDHTISYHVQRTGLTYDEFYKTLGAITEIQVSLSTPAVSIVLDAEE